MIPTNSDRFNQTIGIVKLTLDKWEELVAEEAFPDLSLVMLLASCRDFGLPEPDTLLKVLYDRAFPFPGRALDGGEWVVVEEPAGVDDPADSKSGSTDHPRDEVDVEHDADAAGAASGQVEFSAEEQLLEVGELPDDLAHDVAAVESEVARVGGSLGGGWSTGGVTGPGVAGAVRHEDVVGVGEVRVLRRIGGKDSSDGLDGRPSVGRHPMMFSTPTFGATQVVVTNPTTFKSRIQI